MLTLSQSIIFLIEAFCMGLIFGAGFMKLYLEDHPEVLYSVKKLISENKPHDILHDNQPNKLPVYLPK